MQIIRSSDTLWYVAIEFFIPGSTLHTLIHYAFPELYLHISILVYTNTLLATLNARQSLRGGGLVQGILDSTHSHTLSRASLAGTYEVEYTDLPSLRRVRTRSTRRSTRASLPSWQSNLHLHMNSSTNTGLDSCGEICTPSERVVSGIAL